MLGYSDPMRITGASAARLHERCTATCAPRRHAAACWPCHRATWTPVTSSPRPFEHTARPTSSSLASVTEAT